MAKRLQRLLMFYWLGKVFLKTFEYVGTLCEICTKKINNKICSLIVKVCTLPISISKFDGVLCL